MFTYYQLALELENHNDGVLNDATRMHQYLSDMRLLFQKIAANGMPAALNIEPDMMGYLMQRGSASAIPAKVHHADFPECANLPETAAGLLECVITLARVTAPKARLGFHASMWGHYYDPLDANADIEGSANAVGDFLMGISADTCAVMVALDRQSPDIAMGVNDNAATGKEIGAGDQGLMFGYACNDTPELMPLPIALAHRILNRLTEIRKQGTVAWIRPDSKSQVTVEFDGYKPVRIDTVVVSTQHAPEVTQKEIRQFVIDNVVRPILPTRTKTARSDARRRSSPGIESAST
jgi:hypothetical protein